MMRTRGKEGQTVIGKAFKCAMISTFDFILSYKWTISHRTGLFYGN